MAIGSGSGGSSGAKFGWCVILMNHVSVDEAIASSPVLQRILNSPGATGGYILNLPELKNDERVIMSSRHVLHKSQRGTGFYKTLLQQLGVFTAQQWSGKAPFDITIAQIDAEVELHGWH